MLIVCTYCHTLGTYDVQQTTSVYDPVSGRLNVTCVFASNSLASGCLTIVRGKSSATESFHVTNRSNNTLSIGGLDSDNYTVMTFDIEQDGLPGNRAAYIEEIELQNASKIESGATFIFATVMHTKLGYLDLLLYTLLLRSDACKICLFTSYQLRMSISLLL